MTVHSGYYRRTAGLQEPSSAVKERVLYIMEKAYSRVITDVPDDFDSRDNFIRCLQRIERKSSPGWPYMLRASTNGQWLGWNNLEYDPLRVEELWNDVRMAIDMDEDWYLRCFIKQEPHKKSKVAENRWRLILAGPLHIQLIWHMLFGDFNDKEIECAYHIPSQQGIVLVNGGWRDFYRLWRRRGYDTGLDKTAWDWTTPYFLLEMDLELRTRLMRGKRVGEWRRLAQRMYDGMFKHARIMMSDGTLYEQLYPGIMKSGCVNTISTNSHMQIMVHILYCLEVGIDVYPLPVACGDDTLQRLDQALHLDVYAKFGSIVKSASDGLEFVGHDFLDNGPEPLYLGKHITKFTRVKDEYMAEYLDSMARLYCRRQYMFDFWQAMAKEFGVTLLSRDYYLYWYDHEC